MSMHRGTRGGSMGGLGAVVATSLDLHGRARLYDSDILMDNDFGIIWDGSSGGTFTGSIERIRGRGGSFEFDRSGSTVVAVGADFLVATSQGISMIEGTVPSSPIANRVRIFAVDDGGKTELSSIFNTGARQQITQEP